MEMKALKYIMMALVVTLSACATKKKMQTDANTSATEITQDTRQPSQEQLQFAQKVSDNALYQQNLVSKLSFTLDAGKKNITVPGSIHMRKNDVIRIQLFVPLLGTEVGRLEFTKDYVLIIDRIHKQYIKDDYNKVDFLKKQGINFYSLQSMFWNQLFTPGTQKVTEAELSKFNVEFNKKTNINSLTLKQDKLTFQWLANKAKALIEQVDVTYNGNTSGTTTLHWTYSDFRAFGSKQYPNKQTIAFKSTMEKQPKDIKVTFELNDVSADNNWDTRTTVSEKYKAVKADEVLKKLMNL